MFLVARRIKTGVSHIIIGDVSWEEFGNCTDLVENDVGHGLVSKSRVALDALVHLPLVRWDS